MSMIFIILYEDFPKKMKDLPNKQKQQQVCLVVPEKLVRIYE